MRRLERNEKREGHDKGSRVTKERDEEGKGKGKKCTQNRRERERFV